MSKTTKEVLQQARDLITDPAKWTRRYSARDKERNIVDSRSETAVCWCSLGAIDCVTTEYQEFRSAADVLHPFMGGSIVEFNDLEETTHQQVLEAFDAAIESFDS